MNGENYDWSKFEINYFYPKQPVEKVFESWSTCKGLKSFFIGSIEVLDSQGNKRGDAETFQEGDKYAWQWRHGFSLSGEVKKVITNELVQLSFGYMTVTVRMKQLENATWFQLKQEDIKTLAHDKVFNHMNCYLCWVFFLTNLKSVLAHNMDLRDEDPARASSFEIGYPLKEVW